MAWSGWVTQKGSLIGLGMFNMLLKGIERLINKLGLDDHNY